VRDSLKFKKRWEQFIRPNDKPLPVVAMRINDPERSPVAILSETLTARVHETKRQ
jgi:hypothetical protein